MQKVKVHYGVVLLACTTLLMSCSHTKIFNDKEKQLLPTRTLGNIVQESAERSTNIAEQQLNKQQRTQKLAKIYRSLLTLEPSVKVRAQIQHRLVQLDVTHYEEREELENKQVLGKLANDYQNLLSTYPDRKENEEIQYQLAKTYDLLGQSKASLLTIEKLLKTYPDTHYYAELQFRRAELYYNLQHYSLALTAYQAVLSAENNQGYRINSLYMSGWSLFKLNKLAQADDYFLTVLQKIADTAKTQASFSFEQVSPSLQSLAEDTQRVLSISLSQQQQAKSLVALLTRASDLEHKPFNHLLFQNLAEFLLEKKLFHDALLTYQAYIDHIPESIWSTRFTLTLIELYQQKNNFSKIKQLKESYINHYGLTSTFWLNADTNHRTEVLPYLTQFTLAYARRLYAKAQEVEPEQLRKEQFTQVAYQLKQYLTIIAYTDQQTNQNILAAQEHFLYAEACFEAQQYEEALNTYQMLAYADEYNALAELQKIQKPKRAENLITDTLNQGKVHHDLVIQEKNNQNYIPLSFIQQESAYASIMAIRALLAPYTQNAQSNTTELNKLEQNTQYQALLALRQQYDDQFITHYGDDKRAILVALKAAEYAFDKHNYQDVIRYADFILVAYKADAIAINRAGKTPQLTSTERKFVSIASQLKANVSYQLANFKQAEADYLLALNYVVEQQKNAEIKELIASSIYQQAKAQVALNSDLAVKHFLRLGQVIPHSKYRANAEFDAANLLLKNKRWLSAINVLQQFKKQFPQHSYYSTIPAKLAMAYEKLARWPEAAEQLLIMVAQEKDLELKREAQYTAAEYYLKAGQLNNAIIHFRTYAHQYPEPFELAQEVRFKMSEFYRQTKEPNKRYFWYRKLIKSHQQKSNSIRHNQATFNRSTYLASYAAFYLGKAHQQTFNWTKLKAPLAKTLKKKQKAMKQAVHYYQLVFDWQLAEFVPQANYGIAQMYRRLATDVMASERPHDLDELALEEYELLLEEIAYPFEEKAITVHQANAERAWQNIYDQWVKKSFAALAELEPAKYQKFEVVPEVFNDIF